MNPSDEDIMRDLSKYSIRSGGGDHETKIIYKYYVYALMTETQKINKYRSGIRGGLCIHFLFRLTYFTIFTKKETREKSSCKP